MYGFDGGVISEAERKEAERKTWREAAKARRLAREQGQIVATAAEEARAAAHIEAAAASQGQAGADGDAAAAVDNQHVLSAKEARRDGFALASERYFECLPELVSSQAIWRWLLFMALGLTDCLWLQREFEALAEAASAEAKEAEAKAEALKPKKKEKKKDKKKRG